MSPTARAGFLAGGIVTLALLSLCGLVALLSGGGGVPATAPGGEEDAGSEDGPALDRLRQAQWERQNAPQNDRRYLTVSSLGLYVADRRVSERARSRIVAFLEAARNDANADVRAEAERALRNAPARRPQARK
jgi:hypothetical protein